MKVRRAPARSHGYHWNQKARDSALRADSITVSALHEAMGRAWDVERNDGCLQLVGESTLNPRPKSFLYAL